MKSAYRSHVLLLLLFAAGCMGSVSAESTTVEEVALLAQKGLGEEVLLAYLERAEGNYTVSVEQVVKLKEAGASEKVIAAVLRRRAPATDNTQPEQQLLTSGNRIVYQTERAAASTPLTTVLYRPSTTSYVTYDSSYYPSSYPSSYPSYYSNYYPSYYPYRYSYPYPSFSFSFGSYGWPHRSWGWGGSCGSYGGRGYYGGGHHGGGHHGGGHHSGGGRR